MMVKRLITFLVLMVVGCITYGQGNPVKLSTDHFEKYQQIQLAHLDGWVYKSGSDLSWASPELETHDWERIKPDELTAKFADENGRVEAWFRILLHPDSSFNGLPLGISRQLWAATDIYLDGELVQSFGNSGNPYEAYNPTLKYAEPFKLIPGETHLLALHFVDYETLITPRELRLQPTNLRNLIAITGPEYNGHISDKIKKSFVLGSMAISISSMLLLLFLLLLFLNPSQKIFQLVSILTFFVVLAAIGSNYIVLGKFSYTMDKLIFLVTNGVSLPLMHMLTLLVTEWVLKKKTSWITIFILVSMPFASLLGHLFNISWPFGIINTLMLGYFVYLITTSLKQIKRVEWTVVIAMIILTLGSLVFIFLHKYYLDSFYEHELLLKSIVLLSAPVILLVYISLSYKEIIAEREQEAKKVIRITEEKKVILERQNELLEEQVTQRTQELNKSLENLKSTQSQLVHAEKMASLGELTAGIAHEIQNPLNFVNNFSEVNTELIEELKEELDKGELEEVKVIANDISGNEKKINHHGKRADAIVKGMLQHSRTSSGLKENTDINVLALEYLRLAYHGLMAKDKSFNAEYRTELDETLPGIKVIPEDIGRVLLNLINNAFYACTEKSHALVGSDNLTGHDYKPLVTVTTRNRDEIVEIRVSDNGPGMPAGLTEKIFQPFFTTKPTGEGTGLGLSLAYDIITKGHGGELKVETEEGAGTSFIIVLNNQS